MPDDMARLVGVLRKHHSTSDGRTVDGKLHFVCSCGALYRGNIADHTAVALLSTVDAIVEEHTAELQVAVQRLWAERRPHAQNDPTAEALRAVLTLADQLEQDARTGEYKGGSYAANVLVDVARRIRRTVRQ